MFAHTKLLLLALLATVATAKDTTKPTTTKPISVTTEITESSKNPQANTATGSTTTDDSTTDRANVQFEMMTQRMDISSTEGDNNEYHYLCTVGKKRTQNVMCFAEDNTLWETPHDVNLKLRCPKSGTGYEVAFAQVDVWMTSKDLDCRVTEGGVGYGYIGLQLIAYNTYDFRYIADVFSV
ncbi:uncharacterized protein LOC118738389 [Rhagoletis pomonella]|uniref:uncharacterized protein LOC118738389 n=1 Tax=Rhagoletis pomonella TaxID=28610 RepID=UPI00177C04C4|nr:uncharacterized protein LOC118738389 [Rhagoletis pomonella]